MTSISEINARAWASPIVAHAYRRAEQPYPAEAALLERHRDEITSARLLDLGVGTGRTTGFLAHACRSYVGIDYSPQMIAAARGRFPLADLRTMDARDLSAFADSSFEVAVFSFNGLDYVGPQDRLVVLAEIRRVLVPGGLLIFSSHNRLVAIRKPWSLAHLAGEGGAAAWLRRLVKYAIGLAFAARNRRHERHEPGYALLNDSAAQYRLLTYYIAPEAQVAQLEAVGFGAATAHDLAGRPLAAPLDMAAAAREDYMIHYTARRT